MPLGVAGDPDLADARIGEHAVLQHFQAVRIRSYRPRGSSPPTRSTRCTPYLEVAAFKKDLNAPRSRMRRAEMCGTGSSPAARSAATVSSVRGSGSPGSDGM